MKTLSPPCRLKSRFLFVALGALSPLVLSGCATTPPQKATNAATANSASDSAPSTTAPAKKGLENFSNSKQGLEGPLKDNYVDFSFDYPANWEYKRGEGDPNARNFIKVERQLEDKSKGEFTLENFAVGSLKIKDAAARKPERLSQALNEFGKQFATWPEYKKLSEGPVKIGNYNGYELRFQSSSKNSTRGPLTLWGRLVLLPHPKEAKGVALIMVASNLAPEIKSANDVGTKGQLPVILKSFKFQ
jgi:hypothetical protein